MSDVLKARVMLETGVLLLLHHLLVVIHAGCTSRVSCILLSALVVLIVVASLVGKVLRALVFVRGAIILKSCYRLVDISRRVLVQLLVVAEDDDGDVDGA